MIYLKIFLAILLFLGLNITKTDSAPSNQKYLKKINAGYQELDQGELNTATHIFEGLIAAYPEKYEPHLGLAKVYLENNDYPLAQKELITTLKDNPKCSEAVYDLANIYESNQEWQKAINEFQIFLILEPEKSKEKYIALRIKYLKDNLTKANQEKTN